MSKTFPQKSRQKIRCQFFLDLFGFIAFSGVSQRSELKKHTKKRFAKNIMEIGFEFKFFKQIRPKMQNRFFSIFGKKFSRFWVFLGEGSSKTR
jgi:hypothetical protein